MDFGTFPSEANKTFDSHVIVPFKKFACHGYSPRLMLYKAGQVRGKSVSKLYLSIFHSVFGRLLLTLSTGGLYIIFLFSWKMVKLSRSRALRRKILGAKARARKKEAESFWGGYGTFLDSVVDLKNKSMFRKGSGCPGLDVEFNLDSHIKSWEYRDFGPTYWFKQLFFWWPKSFVLWLIRPYVKFVKTDFVLSKEAVTFNSCSDSVEVMSVAKMKKITFGYGEYDQFCRALEKKLISTFG